MLFKYWTVRLRPTPVSLTTFGAGVVVMDEVRGRVDSRFLKSNSTLYFSAEVANTAAPQLQLIQKQLKSLDNPQASLDLGEDYQIANVLRTYSSEWNNMVIVDRERVISADSLEAALEILFREYVGEKVRVRRPQKVTQVRRTVRRAYEDSALICPLLIEKPRLVTIGNNRTIDFAVRGETEVFELNAAFNFATTGFEETQNKVEAWTWRIDHLRSKGGLLEAKDSDSFTIDEDTPVVATIYPPETERQREVYEESTEEWVNLGVEVVPYDRIDQHTRQLERLIAA